MNTRPLWLACAMLLSSAAVATQASDMPDGIARGRQLFMSTGCYQCHGMVGQGSGFTGPALLPQLWPLPAMLAQLRDPSDAMPPYTAKVMSDADIAAIRSYLASLPPAPEVSSIALLRDALKP